MIYSLWIVPAIALLPASWVLATQGIARVYPLFCSFIYYSAVAYPLSLAILLDFGPRAYMSFSIFVELISYCLIAASVIEVGCDLFWPRRALPGWVPRNLLTLVSAGISGTVVLNPNKVNFISFSYLSVFRTT